LSKKKKTKVSQSNRFTKSKKKATSFYLKN